MTNVRIDEGGNLYIDSETWRVLKLDKTAPQFASVVLAAKSFVIRDKVFRVINQNGGVVRACDRMSELQDEVGEDYPLSSLS